VQASLVSPEIFASNIIQLKDGGVALIIAKIISKVNIALKLLVLIFLLTISKLLIPEYSVLMKFNPTKPRIKGRKILNIPGKKDVTFIFKNEFIATSNILIENKKRPKYRK
jgi:hypothetical protein